MFTLTDVVARARQLVEAKPLFKYASQSAWVGDDGQTISCVYVEDGCGSCLFGQVLMDLGVPEEFFANLEGQSISCLLEDDLDEWLDHSDASWVDEDTRGDLIEWCQTVQNLQDKQQPWWACVETADAQYPLAVAA